MTMTPTPLSRLAPLPAALLRDLSACWITSVEELAALAAAGNRTFGDGLTALGQLLGLPDGQLRALHRAALAELPASVVFELDQGWSAGVGALVVPEAADAPAPPAPAELPRQALLAGWAAAPRHQGNAPAGLAFALATLLGRLGDEPAELAPAFLSWACAAYGGDDNQGLRLDRALRAAQELGVCREQTWPYAEAGAGQPPDGALEEARRYRAARPVWVAPGDVVAIKALIAGGQAVLIVLPVYQHWCDSWAARRLGRVRRPLPGEALLGHQALLATGYRDDPEAPGGGYLVVRNSWGTAWGSDNPDGPGHGHVPYQVVAYSNQAALTITALAARETVALSSETLGALADLPQLYRQTQTLAGAVEQSLRRLDQAVQRLEGLLEGREPSTKNQEARTENQEARTENQEPRTENQEPRTENREPRTESQGAGTASQGTENREPRTESQEPRAAHQEPGTEHQEPKPESRGLGAENQGPRTENQEPPAVPLGVNVHGAAPPAAAPDAQRGNGQVAAQERAMPVLPAGPLAAPQTAAAHQEKRGSGLVLLASPETEEADLLAPNGLRPASGEPLLTIDVRSAYQLARAAGLRKKEADPAYRLHSARVEFDQKPDLGTVFGSENELRESRWAVVVHAEDDAALLEALTPLIQKRCVEQGMPVPPLEFRAGETCGEWLRRSVADINAPLKSGVPVLLYQTGEDSTRWLARHGVSHGPVDPRRGVPFYLMLVARPGSIAPGDRLCIPFDVQYDLDIFWGIGRLCFTDPQSGLHRLDDYRAYAEQVVASEQRSEPVRRKHLAFFATHHPLDMATKLSATELVQPLYTGLEGDSLAQRFGFTQELLLAEQATRSNLDRLLTGAGEAGPPALLFTATHGLGCDLGDPAQQAHQGALVCQDWPGKRHDLLREHYYTGADLPERAALGGLIAVCFACYGVGCPQEDVFVGPPGQPRPLIAPFPLVAQFPQRLLARGALAVLGHVDRAWAHSFRAKNAPAQTQRFEAVLGRLMRGDRIGYATDLLNTTQGVFATMLASMLDQIKAGRQVSEKDVSSLWIARNDARNYLVLGDPAVRLPFGG